LKFGTVENPYFLVGSSSKRNGNHGIAALFILFCDKIFGKLNIRKVAVKGRLLGLSLFK